MSAAAPPIPARPQRAQPQAAPAATVATTAAAAAVHSIPQIPPRPARKMDPSPEREAFTRSPLNALPGTQAYTRPPPQSTHLDVKNDGELMRRPSIDLPKEVGQEGFEYTSYDQLPAEAHGVTDASNHAQVVDPPQTRNVSADIPLHAPTASFPQSTATSRIASVTRTDSRQAAAAGLGKARLDDEVNPSSAHPSPLSRAVTHPDEPLKRAPSNEPHHPLRVRSSFNASTPSLHSSSKPSSIHDPHEGIPEIGMQIPLYRNAGDVQAPSRGSHHPQHAPGIGFFNDGSARAHTRKRSSRQDFTSADIYGLHGHGREPQDQFEREWVAKHPKEAAAEGYNVYLPRPETALSTEQLNKLVQSSEDLPMGANRAMIGTPTQEIAFEATDLYAQRMCSPKPSPLPLGEKKRPGSSDAQPAVESPLRRTSFPINDRRGSSALDSEDDNVYHIDPQHTKRGNKITGGGEADAKMDLGRTGGSIAEEDGHIDGRDEGAPILASDEIVKRPGSAFQQPAVTPEMHHDEFYDSDHYNESRRSSLKPPSRPSSRPGSNQSGGYHGGPLHRYISHEEQHGSGMGTPLEEIEEYEPLFPEDEGVAKPKTASAIRPRLEEHHFPSQDVWEDTPSSLQYLATVETPEPPHEEKALQSSGEKASSAFETPEQEQRRRAGNPTDMNSDSKTFIKPLFKSGIQTEMHDRPGIQRFPSRDIWEDTPSSALFETTVSGPQMDEVLSPPEERPTTTAIPDSQDDGSARSTTAGGFSPMLPRKPSIPARPERRSKLAQEILPDGDDAPSQARGASDEASSSPTKTQAPSIPDRPKPQVPARPAKISQDQGGEAVGSHLSKELSSSPPKSKPAVPARPAGNKFASLKAGFMNDLNSRLQLGPQGPPPKAKEAEPEPVDDTPLVDARKGRAKGPPKRVKASVPEAGGLGFAMSTTLWHIDEHDALRVPSVEAAQLFESKAPAVGASSEMPEPPVTAQINRVLAQNEESNTRSPALTAAKGDGLAEAGEKTFVSLADGKESPTTVKHDAVGAEGDIPQPSLPVRDSEGKDAASATEELASHVASE
ncbi:Hypothetical protein R9X50_00489100 [Acrodontium crateriforme]|uniref:Uncharacterized protein n=1 Tax=Acrodontium crateriforme TaxID=150365 RepID=A0AAQ3M8N2_9PEZI|nr:Hypothetical protein R9X50_00489100 [Acrodontium crateriforme]